MNRRNFICTLGSISFISSYSSAQQQSQDLKRVVKTDAEWKKILTPMQFYVDPPERD